jgi:hypothetical protein
VTRLAGNLPKGESNGLQALARQLVDTPEKVHAVLLLVDCKKISTDIDSGDIEPTARIRRVEAVLAEDYPVAQRMIRRALEKRTGKTVLPYDLEQDLHNAFGSSDDESGQD